MNEFLDRMALQRSVLRVVNRSGHQSELLFGLSQKAIERWMRGNGGDTSSPIVEKVVHISKLLFFLANRSQDSICDEYRDCAGTIAAIQTDLEQLCPEQIKKGANKG